ncbi:hypothetical protein ANN_23413 [Periplaneta americana]|uniref:Endonuclease-reverse transcriptase n=1 Tax=Periplaneta americana TaxID=6978 RepID=A0ABQ8SMH2_PERAM|nr:hypothetical protein ANN_23413 [Periplaneta americana]
MGNACYYSVEKLLSSSLLSKNLKVRIYKTVTLPVLLYGCETWTLTLGEEHRLRVFENKVIRKIFGVKRDEVTGEWRKLHNTELHALYSSPDIIRNLKSRRLRWAGHVARMGESRNAYRVLVGRPEGKRPLGRPRRRWDDNIKMDLREVGYDDRDWLNLAQNRDRWRAYVRAAMNLRRIFSRRKPNCTKRAITTAPDAKDVQVLKAVDHDHPPSLEEVEALRRCISLKRAAGNEPVAGPAQIIQHDLEDVPSGVCLFLPLQRLLGFNQPSDQLNTGFFLEGSADHTTTLQLVPRSRKLEALPPCQ